MKRIKPHASMAALSALTALIQLVSAPALAHGTSKGALRVQHAYALSGPGPASAVGVYFRAIRNDSRQADRLLSASTSVASGVELQRVVQQAGQKSSVPVTAIEIPATASTPMRHNLGEYRLMLLGLRQPLKGGDRFDLTLNFAQAGPLTTKVWMQTGPVGGGATGHSAHSHPAGE